MQSFVRLSRFVYRKRWLLFYAAAFLLASYICFYQLGKSALENWDEAWYADILRNMLRSGDWIVPYWNRTLLLDKPPLQMWLSFPFSLLGGVNEWSARIISAIAGFITIVAVTIYAKKWGMPAAFLAYLTLTLNNTFIWRARSGNLDSLLALLVFLSFALIRTRWKYKYPVLGFTFSLIYLTKASVVIFPFMIFVAGEALYERKNILKNTRQYFLFIVSMIALPALWLLLGTVNIGPSFADYYLFQSDQGVAITGLKHLKTDYVMYLYYALQRRFTYVFIVGLVFALISLRKRESFDLLGYSLLLLAFLSVSQRSNNWYLLPAMPFWSLLVGYGFYRLSSLFPVRKPLTYSALCLALLLSCYIAYKTFTVNIMPIVKADGPVDQKKAGVELSLLSKPTDIIIRADESYPSIIFYADRKVLSYQPSMNQIHATFIGDNELNACLKDRRCPFLSGNEESTKRLTHKLAPLYQWQEVYRSGQEVIMRLK